LRIQEKTTIINLCNKITNLQASLEEVKGWLEVEEFVTVAEQVSFGINDCLAKLGKITNYETGVDRLNNNMEVSNQKIVRLQDDLKVLLEDMQVCPTCESVLDQDAIARMVGA